MYEMYQNGDKGDSWLEALVWELKEGLEAEWTEEALTSIFI